MLENSPDAALLKSHPLLKKMREERLDRRSVEIILGQWYHPLHYFPNFLCKHIALSPNMRTKTRISRIVWQELGEGIPEQAHEEIFIKTMTDVGFSASEFVDVAPLPATRSLVETYAGASADGFENSLGYLYATEAADLTMVGSIGAAVRSFVGSCPLPWVDIHVRQEPDHTSSVDLAFGEDFTEAQVAVIGDAASRMFGLWRSFFSGISKEIDRLSEGESFVQSSDIERVRAVAP